MLSISLAAVSMSVLAERDLEGVWVNTNATPLARPPGYTQLFISAAEARAIDLQRIEREEDRSTPTEPTEWLDERSIEPVNGTLRSSVIVDPPDGQLPGNEALRQHFATLSATILKGLDGPEQRPTQERCIGSQASLPPMLSIPAASLHLIVQTPQATVIFAEWMQQARVIRMNARHAHPAVTSWLGDSIGWWEGDTLVVETHNFTPNDRTRIGVDGVYLVSPRTIVTERFTRISDDEIVYRFTVEDPTWYERPWTGETHFTRTDDRMIEAACHEGNYTMRFMLEAARALEAAR